MVYHSNYLLGAPITKKSQDVFKTAIFERVGGDVEKAYEFIEDAARLQISKASGLLSTNSILAGLSYFVHARAPLVLVLIALLLAIGSFHSKWPSDPKVVSDPRFDFEQEFHLCVNRCICNTLSTYLVFLFLSYCWHSGCCHNMKWKHPPIIKIYEALGAVADGRVKVSSNTAKVFSSSGNKFYDVEYDIEKRAIMANDNGSYWKGYLGYPAIAYLLQTGVFEYNPDMGNLLKGIAWKNINQKFKNDFDKTLAHILSALEPDDTAQLEKYMQKLDSEVKKLDLNLLGKKMVPPEGY